MKKLFVALAILCGATILSVPTFAQEVWDKSSIVLSGECVENNAQFVVDNHSSNDMQGLSEWRVYQNNVLVPPPGTFQLKAGESITFTFSFQGDVRFEADQRPNHPGNSHPKLTLNCVTIPTPTFTPTPTNTEVPTDTETPTNTPSATNSPTHTGTSTSMPPTLTNTATPVPTDTATATSTNTATDVASSTPTIVVSITKTETPKIIPTNTATPTATSTKTLIPPHTLTSTPIVPEATESPTATSINTPDCDQADNCAPTNDSETSEPAAIIVTYGVHEENGMYALSCQFSEGDELVVDANFVSVSGDIVQSSWIDTKSDNGVNCLSAAALHTEANMQDVRFLVKRNGELLYNIVLKREEFTRYRSFLPVILR